MWYGNPQQYVRWFLCHSWFNSYVRVFMCTTNNRTTILNPRLYSCKCVEWGWCTCLRVRVCHLKNCFKCSMIPLMVGVWDLIHWWLKFGKLCIVLPSSPTCEKDNNRKRCESPQVGKIVQAQGWNQENVCEFHTVYCLDLSVWNFELSSTENE